MSGLETLVGGPYINCDPGDGGELADTFTGSTHWDDEVTVAQAEKDGVHITLGAKESHVDPR